MPLPIDAADPRQNIVERQFAIANSAVYVGQEANV